jgi:hypothetical protein
MLKTRRGLFIGALTSAVWIVPVLALAVLPFVASAPNAAAQTPSPDTSTAPALLIKGAVKQELHLTLADLKAMPRTKVTAKGHDATTHEYEGVTLTILLAKAGAPQSGDLRGKSMSLCVGLRPATATAPPSLSPNWTPTSPPNPPW